MDNPIEILEFTKQVNALVEAQVKKRLQEQQTDPYQSEQTKDLITALAKAQTDYPSVANNKSNNYLKAGYADFDNIMSVIRPVLSKHGLILTQFIKIISADNSKILHTRLCHASGQWMESRERIVPMKADDHSWASTVSYKKRHQAMALLNITISGDKSDDDAETNMRTARVQELKGTSLNHNYHNEGQTYTTINAHEHLQLRQALIGWPDLCKIILDNYKISSLADLPRNKYDHVITQVRKNIEQRKKGTKP